MALFYMVPIALSAWMLGRAPAILLALMSELFWVGARMAQSPTISLTYDFYWNSVMRLATYVAFAILFSRLKDTQTSLREREKQISELAMKVMKGQEEERIRLARELHDETSQDLTALTFGFEQLSERLSQNPVRDYASCVESVNQLKHLAVAAIQNLRRLAFQLRPKLLEDLGLEDALSSLCREQLERRGIGVRLVSNPKIGRLSQEAELILFRVAQEAIANIVKHSGADSVVVSLSKTDGMVSLGISDNGVGFRRNEAQPAAKEGEGLGILGMRERVSLFGGSLRIDSKVGKGTELLVSLPIGRLPAGNAVAKLD